MPTCAIVCCNNTHNTRNFENIILSMFLWTKANNFVTTIYYLTKFINVDELVVKKHVLDIDLMVFDLLLFPNSNESKGFHQYHHPRILLSITLPLFEIATPEMFHNYFVHDIDHKLRIYNRREVVLQFPRLINVFTTELPSLFIPGWHFIISTNNISNKNNTPEITYLSDLSLESQHVICACCDYTTSQIMSYNCFTPCIDLNNPNTIIPFERDNIQKITYKWKETKNPFHFNQIHQIWLSNNPIRPNNMYHDHNQVKWKTMNPDITFKLWHKLDIIDLIKTHFNDEILECFEALTPLICKCDFARLLIIYTFGGLYTDVDFIPIKPIKEWCPIYDLSGFLLFSELSEHSETQLCNGFFGSEKPRHFFLKALIDHIVKNETLQHGDVMARTGPKLWENIHLEFPEIIVQNGAYVMPITDHHVLSRDFDSNNACWAYTEWIDGSGWGNGIENRNIVIDKANEINLSQVPTTDIWFIVFIIEITCIVVIIIIWIAIEIRIIQKNIYSFPNETFSIGSPSSLHLKIRKP